LQTPGPTGQRIPRDAREGNCRAHDTGVLTAIKTVTRHMAKEFYLKFADAHYWMTATQTGKYAQKEFETRNEVKEWLVERGVLLTVAEEYLVKADGGRAVRVLLKKHFSV
jgi:shikimate kinase